MTPYEQDMRHRAANSAYEAEEARRMREVEALGRDRTSEPRMGRRFYLAAAAMLAIIAEGRTTDDKTPARAWKLADSMLAEEEK